MTDIRSLEQMLLDNLLQNKARIKLVASFLLALVSLRQNGGVLPSGEKATEET